MNGRRNVGQRSPLVKVLAVLLSCVFAFSGIPTAAIAEADAEAEALAQQELALEEEELAGGDDLALETVGEEPADEGVAFDVGDEGESVTVEEFAGNVAELAGEGAGEGALAEAAYDLAVAAVVPVGDAADVAAGDVLAGRPADALSIANAYREVLAALGVEADVLVADADGALAWNAVRVGGEWLHVDVARGARELADDGAEPWRLLGDEELLARDAARGPWHTLYGAWEPAAEEGAESEAEPAIDEGAEADEELAAEDEATALDETGVQRTAGVLRETDLSAGEVEPLGTTVYFNIYDNGEMRIETSTSTSCTHSWNIDADEYYYDASVDNNTPWRDYSDEVTKLTVTTSILRVTNAKDMFQGMSSLTSANIGRLDTSNCTSFYEIFDSCTSLRTVNAKGLDTSYVTNMNWLFWNDSSLTTVNLAGWDTRAVTSCSGPFYNCSSLKKITVGRYFNFSSYGSIGFPENPSRSDGKWWSSADAAWIPNTSIGSRSKATTYTRTRPAATRDISKSTCKASIKTRAWTGKRLKPTPTVKWGSTKLKKGTHFKIVKYGTNKNNGIKGNWVKIQGIGSYKGTRTVRFRIRKPNVLYYVHRQTYGWEKPYSKRNGQQSGTTGQSKRLEGIYIKLSNKPTSGTIQYRTHIQTYGWEKSWRSAGQMSGTSGKSKRLEAIQIRLTGNMAKKYNVWYRVHAQHFGWMGWAKNGEQSGTAGYSYRLESIQIVLKPKGTSAPPATFMGARRTTAAAFRNKNTLKYKFKRDTWRFENIDESIPWWYYTHTYGSSASDVYEASNGGRGGWCFGFSASLESIRKYAYPKVRSFGGASCIHNIDEYTYSTFKVSGVRQTAHDFIAWCHLVQFDNKVCESYWSHWDKYAGLAKAIKSHIYGGTPIVISLRCSAGGHAVVPISISSNTSKKMVVKIYDCNTPNELQTLTLKKSGGKYVGFTYSQKAWSGGSYYTYNHFTWRTPAGHVKRIVTNGNGKYGFSQGADRNEGKTMVYTNSPSLTVASGGRTYTLSYDTTDSNDMVLPVMSDGGGVGYLYWVGFDTSDMVVQSLERDAFVSVSTFNNGVKVSAKKGSTLHICVSDTSRNSASIDGQKGDAFEVTYREYDGSDVDNTEVKGTATGGTVETTLKDGGDVDVKGATVK